ncbi:spore coat protein U-like protein [Serratia fonticola]|uniref:Spore coat protein U-like protein n=1 Tax=Serratia fonticola TaxID=47917 RepID=A0A542BNY5_SERFO|nr:spore coat U domain-containing protein [Serratia fonticola]TQI80306.1 spore coat protein U-like protein [Serratia fonticola]TQI97667.1 spore coat protein U-like protein [Serratia fonticola]TVZ72165.1 spore coat protein U-like protein [Serratia fonticola]
MYKKVVMLAVFILVAAWGTSSAKAACSTPVVNGAFGSVTSFVVNSTASTSSGSLSVNCGSSLLTVFNSDTISVQLTGSTYSSGTQAVMQAAGNSSDSIPITVCLSTQNCATPMTIGAAATTFNSSQLGLFLIPGGKNFTLPLFFATQPGQTVAAGTYTTTLTFLTNWNICTGLGVGIGGIQICILSQQGPATLSLTVTLVVTNDCTTITAPALSFGSAALLSSFNSVTQTISVTCTKGSVYTVGLDNGAHAVNGVRNMASGSNLISYDIYQSTTSNRWGSSIAAQRWSSTTASSVSTNQLIRNFNYTASILSGQTTPVAGSYSDTITVDLSF